MRNGSVSRPRTAAAQVELHTQHRAPGPSQALSPPTVVYRCGTIHCPSHVRTAASEAPSISASISSSVRLDTATKPMSSGAIQVALPSSSRVSAGRARQRSW